MKKTYCLALLFVVCTVAGSAQSHQPLGALNGAVVDKTGTAISGAIVKLSQSIQGADQESTTGPDGSYHFSNVAPGVFHLTATATGFDGATVSGTLNPAQILTLPQTILQVGKVTTNVEVTLTKADLAQEEVHAEETQRLLGVLPNYFVTYDPNPLSLAAKQKFELAWKTAIDPFTFGVNGIVAGVQQARNSYRGFGQGAEGYAKRYGASYGEFLTGDLITNVLFPTLFRQDPRYIVKGSGSTRSRILYALSRSVICRGDNGHSEFNFSSIGGELAASGISNFYYPANDRNSARDIFEDGLISIAGGAIGNVFEEFLSKKITPRAHHPQTTTP